MGGHTFQRKKAASAANTRPVLPAAVTRSAPFAGVAVSDGFKSPALSVCVGVVPACVLDKTGKLMSMISAKG